MQMMFTLVDEIEMFSCSMFIPNAHYNVFAPSHQCGMRPPAPCFLFSLVFVGVSSNTFFFFPVPPHFQTTPTYLNHPIPLFASLCSTQPQDVRSICIESLVWRETGTRT